MTTPLGVAEARYAAATRTAPAPLSAEPVARSGLCKLAGPRIRQEQHTPRFLFHEATVILVESGELYLDDGQHQLTATGPAAAILVDPRTAADLVKRPAAPENRFRSVFLEISPSMLGTFEHERPRPRVEAEDSPPFSRLGLDHDLDSTLRQVFADIRNASLSDARLRYRLLDLLTALSERGATFRLPPSSTADRVRELVGEAPARRWTAREAGRSLAMSEATLRRRMARERVRFEELIVDVRMHHAMMLLQTTTWGMTQIAEACGYRSRARFSERFRDRFGYPPSAVR